MQVRATVGLYACWHMSAHVPYCARGVCVCVCVCVCACARVLPRVVWTATARLMQPCNCSRDRTQGR